MNMEVGTRLLLEECFLSVKCGHKDFVSRYRGQRAEDAFLVWVDKTGLGAKLGSLLGKKETKEYLKAVVEKGSLGARLFEEEVLKDGV